MLAMEFLSCARCIAADRLPHLMIFRDTATERAAADYFLFYRRELLQTETSLPAQLPHGSLKHHIKMLPDKTDISISKLQHGLNPHSLKLFTDTAPDTPNLVNWQYGHQFTLFVDIGQVHPSTGLPLPLLRRVIGQLCEGFRLGYADADGKMRPA